MTVYRKISLLMLAVFLLVYLLGALFYTQQARHDVQRELEGAAGLAGSLVSPPTTLPESVVGTLRHLTPVDDTGGSRGGGEVPAWFSALIAGGESSPPVVNGWQVNPKDEVEEIWEGFLLISGAMPLVWACVFLPCSSSFGAACAH